MNVLKSVTNTAGKVASSASNLGGKLVGIIFYIAFLALIFGMPIFVIVTMVQNSNKNKEKKK